MSISEKLALYRQWRPQNFRDVVAQEQVVYPLQQSVRNGRFAHAFLFSGSRGTGKTSVAKIFAKAVNCLNPDDGNPCNECEICIAANNGSLMDIQEIDAASNNGVDDVRRLTSEIIFAPVLAQYKVYIIDEVHMLSQQAFNALLKTLEEPPAHAVFILATTEPHRIPATIISRCQHYEFRRISQKDIVQRLRLISDELSLIISDDALSVIAQLANGGMRDAISLLDQLRQMPGEISRDDVLQMAGRVPDQFLHSVAAAILSYDADTLLTSIQELVMSGRDLTRFLLDLSTYMRNLLIAKVSRNPAELIQMTSAGLTRLSELAAQVSTDLISETIASLARLNSELRFSPDIRSSLEIGLLALAARLGGEHLEPIAIPAEAAAGRVVLAEPPELRTGAKQETGLKQRATEEIVEAESLQAAEKADPPLKEEKTDSSLAYDDETLRIWQAVLEAIKEEHLMDLSLMARPAKVSRKEKVWTLTFDHSLKGQYACISEAESRETIRRILQDKLGISVELEVVLEDDAGSNAVSAEEDWVMKLKRITDKRSIPLHIDEELLKGGKN
ncbi:MAG: DNA polymerase III subunit gamma/tau [Clostridiaceae bacterium]|nr:DNA polymerase III subunit gamma/tau [Clostridiaceae bacterium]